MDMEASADRSKIPKDVWEPICQTRSPDIARGRHADVASQRFADAFQCSASGTQSQQHILIIRTSFELGSDACKLETTPAAQA